MMMISDWRNVDIGSCFGNAIGSDLRAF